MNVSRRVTWSAAIIASLLLVALAEVLASIDDASARSIPVGSTR